MSDATVSQASGSSGLIHAPPAKIGEKAAELIRQANIVNIRPEEPFILTSGWASPVYIDCRQLISYPEIRYPLMRLIIDALTAGGVEAIDTYAGGETAGIPFAAWVSEIQDKPMVYVRKTPKGHGRLAQIEGILEEGQHAVLIEDLATDGASKVTFVEALRQAKAVCDHTCVIFYYGVFPSETQPLAEHGLHLHYLADWSLLLTALEAAGEVDPAKLAEVKAFLKDPVAWSANNGGRAE